MFEEDFLTSDWVITWRDLSVSVRTRSPNFFHRNPRPYKRLVNNVTGAIRAGSLVVLMGPSGAGKSTLMGALAHRSASDVFVEGDVRVCGAPVSRFVHQISGFMHQEDLFVETLTVREHLRFMAKLKLCRTRNEKEISRIVATLISEMGLSSCADTRIGGTRGAKVISGGERKRLAFATEVLTDPPILFCDEPTTGLDSFSAQYLITVMKQMSARGKTVLCTIHQPSSELFSMFHQLILLADGRTAFLGDRDTAVRFFEKHGFVCPLNYNPAEIIIKALSVSSKGGSGVSIKRLCDEYSVSETAIQIDQMLARRETEPNITKNFRQRLDSSNKRPFWTTQLFWLTYRSFLQVLRDPSVQTVRILQKVGIALMAGLCFFGSIGLTQAGVQSIQGAIFVLVTENTFPPMYGILPLFPGEFQLFLREYKSDLYSTQLYYFAKTISFVSFRHVDVHSQLMWTCTSILKIELPGLIIEPVLFVIVVYLIGGLRQTLYAFFMTATIAILTTNVAAACGCFFSNAFGSVSVALAFLVPVDYTLMVTSGLFIKLSSIPAVISWFRYLSWFMYSNEALSIVQWENVNNITCEYDNPEIPCLENGGDVLEKFDFSSSRLSQDIIAMSVLYCVFHVLAYVSLRWKTNKNS